VLPAISEKESKFISQQKVFFVATAPLSPNYRVNVSPKSPGSSVVILNPHEVAYADLTGSGSETCSHVMENGRMTLLFCNLEEGPPKILRLHGYARVIIRRDVEEDLMKKFPKAIVQSPGFRCVYRMRVDRVSSSCGYSLPIMRFDRYRETLNEYFDKKGCDGAKQYQIEKNSFSIDGMKSLTHWNVDSSREKVLSISKDGYYFGKIVGKDSSMKERLMSSVEQIVFVFSGYSNNYSLMQKIAIFFAGALIGFYCSKR